MNNILLNIVRKNKRVKLTALMLILLNLNISLVSIWHEHPNPINSGNFENYVNSGQIFSTQKLHLEFSEIGGCLICLFLSHYFGAFVLSQNIQVFTFSFIGIISLFAIGLLLLYRVNYSSRAPPQIIPNSCLI